MWWRLVLYVSFAPACLASLGYMLTCMSACLLVNSTIILFLMVVKSLNPIFILFSKTMLFLVFVPIPCIDTVFLCLYRSPVSVPFSYMCTDPMYPYCFPVYWYLLCLTWHAITCHLTSACYYLIPVWYHLSPATWHITACLVIIIFRESCSDILYYVQWPVLLILMYSYSSWTCHVPAIPVIW